ncbi:MAG: DUF305 domain-containing protein, partial [Pseudomonadota bacterium]
MSINSRILLGLLFCVSSAHAAYAEGGVPIVQPGAPGESPRQLRADEAVAIADTSYAEADVRFMSDMIPHHHQALVMSRL